MAVNEIFTDFALKQTIIKANFDIQGNLFEKSCTLFNTKL